jgi:transcriptional regulator with XRE-family HTH domain
MATRSLSVTDEDFAANRTERSRAKSSSEGQVSKTQRGTTQFGRWLEERIKLKGWTMAQLARETGISEAMISAWGRDTRGARGPNIQHIRAIALAFGVSREDVLRVFDDDDEGPIDRVARELAAMVIQDPDQSLDAVTDELMETIIRNTARLSTDLTAIILKHLREARPAKRAGQRKEEEVPPNDPQPSPDAL